MEILPSQRALFDIPDDVAFLNAATMTPLPLAALEAGQRGLDRKRRPWTLTSDQFFVDTGSIRPKLARLIGADVEGVAIIPSASYGLSTAARNLPAPEGTSILTLADQFPSNVYAWRALARRTGAKVVTVSPGHNESLSDALLSAIDETTSIVACPQIRWTDGALIDLEAVGRRCRDVGAALVLDLSQSCGALRFDVRAVKPDFVVSVGYKWLFGPYGLSFLYAAPHRRDGEPLEENWIARRGSEDFTRLIDYTDEYGPGAQRYDMGERSNFALLPAFEASLDILLDWSVERTEATLAHMNARLTHALAGIGLTRSGPDAAGANYIGVDLPHSAPDDLTIRLSDRRIYVSKRGNTLRITPHVYNTEDDCNALVDALKTEL